MKALHKVQKQRQRNKARILSCELHSFDCRGAIEREKAKQEKWGVSIPISPILIRCRCQNCGGTMSLMYAMPYMEALGHIQKQEART